MSDAPATGGLTTDALPDAVTQSPGPAPAAPVTPSAPAPPVGTTDLLAELPVDRAVFDRGYVESIRREAQRYRTEAQERAAGLQTYEDVFGQYGQEDRDVWFKLASTWATDPAQAARVMQQIASGVLSDENSDGGSAGAAPVGDQADADATIPAGLTPEQVAELIDQRLQTREQAAAEERAINDVFSEIRAGGYDPTTAEGFMVLWHANHETGGNIPQAIEKVQAFRQSIIDDYVAGRTSGRVAMPSPNGVQANTAAQPITNLDEARRATDAFLRERRGAV